MAFTAEEVIAITKITGVTGDYLTTSAIATRFRIYYSEISTEIEDAVRNLINLWEENDLDTNFTKLHPNVANFGVDDDPDRLRASIRRQLANHLYLGGLINTGAGQLVRA